MTPPALAADGAERRRAPRRASPDPHPRSAKPANGLHRVVPVAGLLLVAVCLYAARAVMIPIAIALLFAFLLSPLVAQVRRTGLSQTLSVLVVVAFALALIAGLGWALLSQIDALANDLPRYRESISRKIADLQRARQGGTIEKVTTTAEDVMKQIDKSPPGTQKPVPVVVSSPSPLRQIPQVLEFLGIAVFALVLVVFMLIQQRDLRARVILLFGHRRMAITTRLFEEASTRISRYLLTQTLINGAFGAGVGFGLFLIGVPFALVLGCVAAVLRFIPYVGAWLATAIPIVLSLATFDGWTKPLLVVGLFVLIEGVVLFVLEPLLYGRSAGVTALALLVGAGFWTLIWGPIGLALATPLTVCLVVFSRSIPGLEFIEILMSDKPAAAPRHIFYQRLLAADEREAADLLSETGRSSSPQAAFDEIVAPALARARRDREADRLAAGEYEALLAATRRLVQEMPLAASARVEPPSGPANADLGDVLVVSYPADDEADAIGLVALERVLEASGCRIRILPARSVANSDQNGEDSEADGSAARPAVICVGAVGAVASGRMSDLVQELRAVYPETPILVACWGAKARPAAKAALAKTGADAIATSLAEARSAVMRLLHSTAAASAGGVTVFPGARLAARRHSDQ